MKNLLEFIDLAERNRKYPTNTAQGIKAALKIFLGEANEEEHNSIELFKERLDQISQSAYNKNKEKISAASFQVYVRRIKKLFADYEKYGNDPSKMALWNPATKAPTLQQNKKAKSTEPNKTLVNSTVDEKTSDTDILDKHEIRLSTGKAIFFVPSQITETDVALIQSFVDYLKAKAKLQIKR